MSDRLFRVATERSLNLRKSGAASAPIVASISPQALACVTGAANAAGYAPAWVGGWLGPDNKTLYADSLGPDNSSVDAVLLDRTAFETQDAPDVYGRRWGVVRGWVYLAYLTALPETRRCSVCGEVVDLTSAGRLSEHSAPSGGKCPQSGQQPAEVAA